MKKFRAVVEMISVRIGWMVLLFSCVLFLFHGCAAQKIEVRKISELPRGESLVFGRVEVIRNGKEMKWARYGTNLSLIIQREGENEAFAYKLVEEDGTFYWHLPTGRYTILGFDWARMSGRIFTTFDVPGPDPTYIGTLIIRFAGYRYQWEIKDHFLFAIEKLEKKFPEFKEEPLKNLMIKEEDS